MLVRLTSIGLNPSAVVLAFAFFVIPIVSFADGEEQSLESLPDWTKIMLADQERLARVECDQAAREVFISTIGRAAGLHDVVAALAVQGVSSKLAKELRLSQITTSAQRVVAALVAWRLADRMTQLLEGNGAREDLVVAPAQAAWLTANGPFSSLNAAVKLWDAGDTSAAAAVAVGHLAQEAGRQAMEEWWRLKTWKDRVRGIRGQSRLCGTWQWVIHNHQRHHEEQKLSLTFPPSGKDGTPLPGLSEIVVLGDVVYLRWERDGKVQEDSLLFSKEGQRLEGTFVNSQGGWGSVSGKRTASCMP
ncbi:MAG TPA: hypothetical protein VH332_02720 [Nitrospira sp.]